jgi:hypothetical protein
MHDDEVKCATKVSRTGMSGAVFTEYCGRGRHADGCPLGERPPSTSTTCARCHHVFTSAKDGPGPRVSTSAGLIDEALVNEIAAHQERCFVVGDWVRGEWNNGWPVSLTGEVAMQPDVSGEKLGISVRIAESTVFVAGAVCHFLVKPGDLRRIPRPGQVDPTHGVRMPQDAAEWAAVMGEAGISASGPIQYQSTVVGWTRVAEIQQWQPNASYPSAPRQPNVVEQLVESPVLYDGLTAEQCLSLYERSQREDMTILSSWDPPLSANQLAAARALWSAQLAAKVAASAEAERLTVFVDDQSEP